MKSRQALHLSIAAFIASLSMISLANNEKGGKETKEGKEGPCKTIKESCTKAGFVQGGAKDGKGLWLDCVNPIMQGTTAKKSVLPLPKVEASVITACKEKHPKFGEGKIGN